MGTSLPTGVLTISLSSAMTHARHRPPRLLAPWQSHITALLSCFPVLLNKCSLSSLLRLCSSSLSYLASRLSSSLQFSCTYQPVVYAFCLLFSLSLASVSRSPYTPFVQVFIYLLLTSSSETVFSTQSRPVNHSISVISVFHPMLSRFNLHFQLFYQSYQVSTLFSSYDLYLQQTGFIYFSTTFSRGFGELPPQKAPIPIV